MTANLTPKVQRAHELIAFFRAQWDKEAAELNRLANTPLVQGYLRAHRARHQADIDAHRPIDSARQGYPSLCDECSDWPDEARP